MEPIMVWRWTSAPSELKALSTSESGNEEWLILVPHGYQYVDWLDSPAFKNMKKYSTDRGVIFISTYS